MTYLQLLKTVKLPIFTTLDVNRYFSCGGEQSVRIQLSRFVKKGLLRSIKRGVYAFPETDLDEFQIANKIYTPSYVSLESALNYHGIIPDIPVGGVTSVTTITTKKFSTSLGRYYYHKIPPKLFWGFSLEPFLMAFAEKALLDYTYLYGQKATRGLRIDWQKIDKEKFKEYDQYYR